MKYKASQKGEKEQSMMKSFWKEKRNRIYLKMAAIFIVTAMAAAVLFLLDNSRILPQNEAGAAVVKRNPPGEGEREEELRVQIGETEDTITVTVGEEQFSKEELQEEFEKAGIELEKLILGENAGLDEVRSDLNLITRLPDSGIAVAWELDNYEVMNLQGELQTDLLQERGTLVRLDAFLSYGEEKAQHTFYANLFPPRLSLTEKLLHEINEELVRLNEATKEESSMPLPDTVEGRIVVWQYVTDFRAAGLLLLGVALSLSIYASDRQKEKKADEERIRQLELDYPQVINRFTLYLGAGMSVRKVWMKLAEDYQNQEKTKGKRAVYEEMVYTMHEIQSGTSENECYERFGERCGLTVYRKFGALLSQNLKKGTKGLADLLKQEAANTFEERKSLARKLGEEAGTKLLLPMFLMFGMVLAIIVVPVFFSMQM